MKTITYFLLSLWSLSAYTQNHQLQYQADKWPMYTAVHFSKANWDGSNKGYISVYFKDGNWIESLKWHEGHHQATLVPAKIDPQTFNVIHFKNFRCTNGSCQQLGDMQWDQKLEGYKLAMGEFSDTVVHIPAYWHSYDFDFASLMVAFLFKKEIGDHLFDRADFQQKNGNFVFGPIGPVHMKYQGLQVIDGISCHLYQIDGVGLENKGGEIWFDQKQTLLRGYKIKLPDENSYQDVELKYLKQEQMTLEEWESFKATKWTE